MLRGWQNRNVHTREPRDLGYQACGVRSNIEHSLVARFTRGVMTKPIPDKAEVALELPDKLYIGTFERSSRFDAHLDQTGVSLTLHRTGDADVRKSGAFCGYPERLGHYGRFDATG